MKKVIFLFLIISLISCNKNDLITDPLETISNPPPTIYPGPYYPCYPNSWWDYLVNGTTLQSWTVSSDYEPHSYLISNDEYSDSVLVPLLNGNPIYGYDKIIFQAPPWQGVYKEWPILRETVGYQFKRNWTDDRFGDFNEYVEVTGKSFDGVDSLLILEGHWVYGPLEDVRSHEVYKKNIGLTHHYRIDTTTNDTLYKQVLIDHFIDN